MGNVCCTISDETTIISNLPEFKSRLKEEYKTYLQSLNQLKSKLNSSIIYNDWNSENNPNINNMNSIIPKRFYIIPRVWFENWEKRIQFIIENNKYQEYDFSFEFKNEDKLSKFYYELITDELWLMLNRNPIYKIDKQRKIKNSIIINNLIIFHSSNNNNNIEIFFFENEDDLFFTNLLFSFEKCDNVKNVFNNTLKLLKSSPIKEILGNIHYDKSEQFFVKNNKTIIYNKTIKIDEKIKTFRIKQYELLINYQNQEKGSSSDEDIEKNKKVNENRIITSYYEINKNNNIVSEEGLINSNQNNGESTAMGYDASRPSLNIQNNNNVQLNNRINNNFSRNNTRYIRVCKNPNNNNLYTRNNNNNTNKSKNLIFSLKNNSMIENKITENNKFSRNPYLFLKADISTIDDNNNKKGSNIFNFFEDNKNNQNFFESILYCLLNIKKLTEYFLNNECNNKISDNSFYKEYLNIIEYLNKNKKIKIKDIIDNNDNNTLKIGKNNLIKSCPSYNFQKILKLIIFQNSFNIISKIINTLHIELNESSKKIDNVNIEKDSSEEIINPNEEQKNKKYNQFIKECEENNKSIIFDMFYGIKESKIICNKCNKNFYKYEIINILEFSMDKLNKYIIRKEINENNIIKNENTNIKYVSIDDCLSYYLKGKNEDDNMFINCPFCKDYQSYTMTNNINKYPEIFIICFENDIINISQDEYEIKINFNETIKLSNDEYKLIGIISTKKDVNSNNDNDIFDTFCKDYISQKWIFYDDNKICYYDLNKNKNEILPVVLFYEKFKI